MTAQPGFVCPTCDRRVPIPREDRTPRHRSQVLIAVPKDAAEDGEEVLRSLLSAARDSLVKSGVLPYDKDVPPYFVLCAVLADWLHSR